MDCCEYRPKLLKCPLCIWYDVLFLYLRHPLAPFLYGRGVTTSLILCFVSLQLICLDGGTAENWATELLGYTKEDVA